MKNINPYDFSINSIIKGQPNHTTIKNVDKIRPNNIKLLSGNTINYKKRTNLSIDGYYKKVKVMRFIRKIGDGITFSIMKLFKLIKYNQTKALNTPTIVKGIPDNSSIDKK